MKNDQQEAFEKVLTSTLSRVIDFLRYAEAKNAALLTFASAWIIGSINLLTNSSELAAQWRPTLIYALPLFCLAALAAILSFLPRIHLARLHNDPEQSRSLLYFGDAAKFSPAVYRERVNERYYPVEGQSATQRYLDDIAVQIAVNSQITVRKLSLFQAGSFAVLIALTILTWPAWRTLYHLVQDAVSVG